MSDVPHATQDDWVFTGAHRALPVWTVFLPLIPIPLLIVAYMFGFYAMLPVLVLFVGLVIYVLVLAATARTRVRATRRGLVITKQGSDAIVRWESAANFRSASQNNSLLVLFDENGAPRQLFAGRVTVRHRPGFSFRIDPADLARGLNDYRAWCLAGAPDDEKPELDPDLAAWLAMSGR